jgi:predicted NBD/HSP70 family sugar kinase
MTAEPWAVGVDLGGTKLEAALVDGRGRILARQLFAP